MPMITLMPSTLVTSEAVSAQANTWPTTVAMETMMTTSSACKVAPLSLFYLCVDRPTQPCGAQHPAYHAIILLSVICRSRAVGPWYYMRP